MARPKDAHPLCDPKLAKTLESLLYLEGVPEDEKEDYAHEVLIKALRARQPPSTPEGWALLAKKIARDEAASYVRRVRRRSRWDTGPTERPDMAAARTHGGDEVVAQHERLDAIDALIANGGLPRSARLILAAACDGRSHAEVAAELGIGVQTVRNVLCIVRKAVRE